MKNIVKSQTPVLTILEYDPNDVYKRRTGKVCRLPINSREEFKMMFGTVREGLFIYERDVGLPGLTEVSLDCLLNHCE